MRRLLILVALLAAAPLAAADHVYSHRYLTLVHVAGSDGEAVRDVEAALSPSFGTGDCDRRPNAFGAGLPRTSARTDADGFAILCAHAHALPSSASLSLTVAGLTGTVAADRDTRLTVVQVTTGEPGEGGGLLVHARVWVPGEQQLEGVPVTGFARPDVLVNLTVTWAEGEPTLANATTDSYGDVLFRVPWPEGAQATGLALESAFGSANSTEVRPGLASFVLTSGNVERSILRLAAEIPQETPLTPLLAVFALAAAGGALRRAR